MVNALNSMGLETVLDWLYKSRFALEDKEPLSLRQYLLETKEVIEAEERMKKIEGNLANLSAEERDRRNKILDEEKEGVGQLI